MNARVAPIVVAFLLAIVATGYFITAADSDRRDIRDLFEQYKAAILADDPQAVYATVSPSTREWLETVRLSAIDAAPDHIFTMNGRDQSLVLALRECFTTEQLTGSSIPELAERVPDLLAPPFAIQKMRLRIEAIEDETADTSFWFRHEGEWTPFYAAGPAFVKHDGQWSLSLAEGAWPYPMIEHSLTRQDWLDVGREDWATTYGVPFDERLFSGPIGRSNQSRSLIMSRENSPP